MMVMYPRCGFVRAVNSVSKHSSVSRSSSPVIRTRLSATGFWLLDFTADFLPSPPLNRLPHLPIPLRQQRPHNLLRVVDIHLAAKSFEVERLRGHIGKV